MREGVAGYGCYWMMLEMLRDCPKYRTFYFPESFAYSFHVQDVSLIERVCKDYALFEFDKDDYISSPWLDTVMDEYDEQKKKRSEAGRRGAARRWASSSMEDGKAIALPSMEDGKAIAYNTTLFDVTQDNATQPNQESGEDWRGILSKESRKVDAEYMEALATSQPAGHAPGYVAQVCLQFGMTEAVCDFICERTNNAEMSHPTYRKFCAIVNRLNGEKWKPNLPANFFLAKLFN